MHPLRQHIEKIISLSDTEFEHVLSHFEHKSLRKHQYLVQEGEYDKYDNWVIKGCLKAFYTNSDGKEHILQFAIEDWWVADYDAYFNTLQATINVDCMEPCEILQISLANREKLCTDLHKMEYFFRQKITNGYVALQKRILSLLSNNPQERYEEFIRLYPTLKDRIPKKYIAAYLGVSRETLSRLYSNNS
ncbi:Crp/Fnr family transcriptional regulator [Algivirga pacifica]|uniref:Cyclic nucleotide-binding domain-containing protein n=1 Tax=Algivirga pacifica TaxID=1162670 RepID=A0ABP9DIU7_9BACT